MAANLIFGVRIPFKFEHSSELATCYTLGGNLASTMWACIYVWPTSMYDLHLCVTYIYVTYIYVWPSSMCDLHLCVSYNV